MKKLKLNKETIARLDNPDKIYGGVAPTWGCGVSIVQSAVSHCGYGGPSDQETLEAASCCGNNCTFDCCNIR
jgi:hypothetical protein